MRYRTQESQHAALSSACAGKTNEESDLQAATVWRHASFVLTCDRAVCVRAFTLVTVFLWRVTIYVWGCAEILPCIVLSIDIGEKQISCTSWPLTDEAEWQNLRFV